MTQSLKRSGVRGCSSPGDSHLLLCHDRKWRLRAQSAALKTLYPSVIYSRQPCRAYRTVAPSFLRRSVCEVQEHHMARVLHQKKKKPRPQDGRTSGDLAFQCFPLALQVQCFSQTRAWRWWSATITGFPPSPDSHVNEYLNTVIQNREKGQSSLCDSRLQDSGVRRHRERPNSLQPFVLETSPALIAIFIHLSGRINLLSRSHPLTVLRECNRTFEKPERGRGLQRKRRARKNTESYFDIDERLY